MSTKIERLRYYERQYLRSFDLAAEQDYHLEMRRRLNLALHLCGIVDGLELLEGEVVPGAPDQVYVSPGMAIDGYGREILLAAPYAFDEEDAVANELEPGRTYSVWIAYRRQAATPPAPGYRVCDLEDQYTRWCESFRLLLVEQSPTSDDKPDVFEPLPDDPDKAPFPVRLGTVEWKTDPVTGMGIFANPLSQGREYVGSRSQRILAPAFPKPDPANPAAAAVFDPLGQASALDPPLSVVVEDNLFAGKNLVVGDNFTVDKTKIKPPPPGTFPSATGNLKVAGDLFLASNVYASVAGEWLDLGEYLKTFVPEILVGEQTIVPVAGADPSKGTEVITVSTKLPQVSDSSLAVSLSGIEWIDWTKFGEWLGEVDQNTPVQLDVTVLSKSVNGQDHEFTVQWEIGPRSTAAGLNPAMLNVSSFKVSWVAVFTP